MEFRTAGGSTPGHLAARVNRSVYCAGFIALERENLRISRPECLSEPFGRDCGWHCNFRSMRNNNGLGFAAACEPRSGTSRAG